ncbi:cold shock domain-containing protein 3-like [Schistocerca piceifrons]|uniref:cold shock domain-containing protein 3-like n=1 Tax=Schistocerca piceifrons TaxID=274613 RepID=UPI001F5F281B|nr:cold shock domain-containing protein 3-like [Schistocerca piceifrons]
MVSTGKLNEQRILNKVQLESVDNLIRMWEDICDCDRGVGGFVAVGGGDGSGSGGGDGNGNVGGGHVTFLDAGLAHLAKRLLRVAAGSGRLAGHSCFLDGGVDHRYPLPPEGRGGGGGGSLSIVPSPSESELSRRFSPALPALASAGAVTAAGGWGSRWALRGGGCRGCRFRCRFCGCYGYDRLFV